jgi:hypothetical protein
MHTTLGSGEAALGAMVFDALVAALLAAADLGLAAVGAFEEGDALPYQALATGAADLLALHIDTLRARLGFSYKT